MSSDTGKRPGCCAAGLVMTQTRPARNTRLSAPPLMLAAHAITKTFGGNRAVDEVSFTIEAGTITGLIGPNGAGKTTLFNCLAGLLPPTSGSLTLDGERIDGLSPDRVFAQGRSPAPSRSRAPFRK